MAFFVDGIYLVDGNAGADCFFPLQEKAAGVVRNPSAEAQAQRCVKAQKSVTQKSSEDAVFNILVDDV